jgi:hypothetical protein
MSMLLIGAVGAQEPAQSARPDRIHTWGIKHSDKELHLEPNALVITKRTSIFFSSGSTDRTPPSEYVFPDKIPLSAIVATVEEVVTHKPAEEARNRTLKRLDPENMLAEIGEAGEAAFGAPAYPVMLLAQAGALQVFHGVRTKLYSVRIVMDNKSTTKQTRWPPESDKPGRETTKRNGSQEVHQSPNHPGRDSSLLQETTM